MSRALAMLAAATLVSLAPAGCSSDNPIGRTAGSVVRTMTGAASRADHDRASSWLEGRFSSARQAASDERYFEVNLRHVRIWNGDEARDDGHWFYVEQALANNPDAPYRQQIYRLWLRPDGRIECAVYDLPEPERFVGADARAFKSMSPLSLEKREGCAVVFSKISDKAMAGSTGSTTCASDLRGAAYATSEITLTPESIESWDRGFDKNGRQVWGAEAGAYEFRRVGAQSD